MVNRADENLPAQWQDTANLILGLWLAISPWFLTYASPGAAWNVRLAGLAIAAFAVWALVDYEPWKEWANVILAAWLIISPWFLDTSWLGPAFYNQVSVGILVGILALWLTATTTDSGGLATRR
jgi:SPW repeat